MKNITFLSALLATSILAGHAAYACSSTQVQGTDGECYPSSGSCGDNCSYQYDGNILYIDGPADKTQTGKIQDGAFSGLWESKIPTTVTDVVIRGNITDIGFVAFFMADRVQNLKLPDSLKTIGEHAFVDMKSLTNLTLPNNLSGIGSGAFEGLSGLKSLLIPDTVTRIPSDAFSGCSGIEKLTIPDSVTSIGDGAFSYMSGLTSLTLGKNITNISPDAFKGITNLTELNISDTLSESLDLSYLINDSNFQSAASAYEARLSSYEMYLGFGYPEEMARRRSGIDEYKQKLDAAAEALRNKVASLTINCSGNADVCKQNILNALPQSYKDALGDYEPFIFAGASYKQKNPDGSVAYYTGDGKLKTIKGKKIYTVEEAEEVTKNGERFHVGITYK